MENEINSAKMVAIGKMAILFDNFYALQDLDQRMLWPLKHYNLFYEGEENDGDFIGNIYVFLQSEMCIYGRELSSHRKKFIKKILNLCNRPNVRRNLERLYIEQSALFEPIVKF